MRTLGRPRLPQRQQSVAHSPLTGLSSVVHVCDCNRIPLLITLVRRVSTDGAATWTKAASATPENPTVMFGYSSLTLLPAGARSSMLSGSVRVGVGLTYETAGASCTVDTSACRIMYRNFSFPARLLGY